MTDQGFTSLRLRIQDPTPDGPVQTEIEASSLYGPRFQEVVKTVQAKHEARVARARGDAEAPGVGE